MRGQLQSITVTANILAIKGYLYNLCSGKKRRKTVNNYKPEILLIQDC